MYNFHSHLSWLFFAMARRSHVNKKGRICIHKLVPCFIECVALYANCRSPIDVFAIRIFLLAVRLEGPEKYLNAIRVFVVTSLFVECFVRFEPIFRRDGQRAFRTYERN